MRPRSYGRTCTVPVVAAELPARSVAASRTRYGPARGGRHANTRVPASTRARVEKENPARRIATVTNAGLSTVKRSALRRRWRGALRAVSSRRTASCAGRA